MSLSFLGYSQTGYESTRNNGANQTTERYVINSPGNTPSTSFTTWRVKDSTFIEWLFPYLYLRKIPDSINIGNPKNFLHTGSDGRVLSSSITWLYPDTFNIFPTKSYLFTNYFDKAQSDTRYLMSFTELDPTVPNYSKSLNSFGDIKSSTDSLYEPIFSKNTAFNKNFGAISGTVTEGNDSRVLNGQTAFSWGNHATQGYLVGTDTISLSNRINNKQNQLNGTGFVKATGPIISYDNSTYLTSEIDGSVTNELQTISKVGNIATLSNGGGSFSVTDADSSITNEIQSLSINNRTISISSGNSVTVPQANWDSLLNKPAQYNPSAGTGISITGTYPNQTFTNTSPDQTVVLTGGTGISTSGTYPNFTITNTAVPVTWSFNNSPGRSIVTIAAAANGFQISSTRNADVGYSITITSTVSLSGNQVGYVVLEIAPTNSSTASDWIEIARVASGQSGALVIGLTLNQTGGGQITGSVPAGYYARIRSVNTTGTPVFTMNSGQETLK